MTANDQSGNLTRRNDARNPNPVPAKQCLQQRQGGPSVGRQLPHGKQSTLQITALLCPSMDGMIPVWFGKKQKSPLLPRCSSSGGKVHFQHKNLDDSGHFPWLVHALKEGWPANLSADGQLLQESWHRGAISATQADHQQHKIQQEMTDQLLVDI